MFAARQGFNAVSLNERRVGAAATLSTITFSAYNSANYSTSKAAFGAGSLDVEADNKLIYYNNYSSSSTGGGWPTGTGDFCIEAWLWIPSGRSRTATGDLVALNYDGGLGIRIGNGYNAGSFNFIQIWARGQADLDRASYNWPNETWVHMAAQRKSSTITFWANGNRLTRQNGPNGTAATRNFPTGTSQLTIGSYNNGGGTDETMKCWIDELCVSNSWRYDDSKTTYVVPTSAFTVDEYTNLLIHFDSNLTTAAS